MSKMVEVILDHILARNAIVNMTIELQNGFHLSGIVRLMNEQMDK